MGIFQEKLQKIIDNKKITNNTKVNCDTKEEDVKWFYPLLNSIQSKNSKGEFILHSSMQKLYEIGSKFDKEHEKFVLSSPTGSGKSGVIYYLCAQWFKRNSKRNIFHLINPLNVLNDQTTYDLIFVLKQLIKNNNLNFKDFAIYLNRCDGDSAGKVLDNRECIPVYSFKDYSNQNRKKFELIISCVPSVKNIEKKWNKDDCLSVIDEVHSVKFDNLDVDEDSFKDVNYAKFWDCVNKYSAYIRGITATPTEEMFIKEFGEPFEKYICKVSFSEALESGRVVMACPIFTSYIGNFSLKNIMLEQKQVNIKNNLCIEYHKILFSCSTNEEIAELILTNDYQGIFYISTSNFGKLKARKNGNTIEILEKNMTIPEFSNSIETLEEDCYVFHIRQLIAGVNVKGLTGCVLQMIEQKTNCITTQQTIGRCLRKKGNKKGGIVTFLLENKDSDQNFDESKLKAVYNLMNAMYGDNWIASELNKKKNKNPKNNEKQPTPPKETSTDNTVEMHSYYMDVKISFQQCKERYELGEKLGIEILKENAMKSANAAIIKYSSTAIFGAQKERYEETVKKLSSECDWKPFVDYVGWNVL